MVDRSTIATTARVVLVNENLARFACPREDALGKRLSWDGGATWMTVVGVVGNVHVAALDERPTLDTYVPFAQSPVPELSLVLRSDRDPIRLASQLRAEVLAIDREQPISDIYLLSNLVARSFAGRRFHMLLVSSFALLALLLASLGIYGVVSYALARRTAEIGIRVALGASPPAVLRLLLSSALATTAVGVMIGIFLALVLGRFLESPLRHCEPRLRRIRRRDRCADRRRARGQPWAGAPRPAHRPSRALRAE